MSPPEKEAAQQDQGGQTGGSRGVFGAEGPALAPELLPGIAQKALGPGLGLLRLFTGGETLPLKQFHDGDAQRLRQRFQKGDVGGALAPLPFGDGPVRNVEQTGQLLLGHALLGADLFDETARFCIIHGEPPV